MKNTVEFLKKHDLLKYLSPIHSPMLCEVVYLRKYQGFTGKIAALSPCIGKGDEFEQTGLVQYNVTMDHLKQYFKENNKLYIGKRKQEVVIKTYRKHKIYDMVTFEGFESINSSDDVYIINENLHCFRHYMCREYNGIYFEQGPQGGNQDGKYIFDYLFKKNFFGKNTNN